MRSYVGLSAPTTDLNRTATKRDGQEGEARLGRPTYDHRARYDTPTETVPLTVSDKNTHIYVAGKTGQGKSVALENMVFDDLAAGRGLCFMDPHGTSARKIADCVPPERFDDLIYLDPLDPRCPTFNPMLTDNPSLRAEQILTTIHNKYPDSWGPNLEYILLNDLRLLLANEGTTLLDLK